MAISDVKVSYRSPDSTLVGFIYTPASGETRTLNGGFLFYGPQNSYDPVQPNLGFPEAASVSQQGSDFASNVTPPVGPGETWYFIVGVEFTDGSTEADVVQQAVNAPSTGGQATEVQVSSSALEIPITGQATITLQALASGSGTPGRSVNFGFKTGSVKGNFSPANPVPTDANGKATVTFRPLEPGQAHIEAECDGLSAGIKVKVKNS